MKELVNHNNESFDSYLSKNDKELDEALVSLRFMKVVDDFLVAQKITKRSFAEKIGCSESYVSQLMSGTKNINASFINKFEKAFNVKINFDIIRVKQVEGKPNAVLSL
jgi:transcriptional regulator with XRE-family HTH domain